jgi:DNA repair protein RecO (recombination protein O)
MPNIHVCTDFIDAFLIHQRPYLEKKIITHLFTQTQGLITAVTHSSKKKQQSLQLFTPLSCQIQNHSSLHQLKKIEHKSQKMLPPLHGKCLFAGLYFNELIYRLCQENQPQNYLYQYYYSCVAQLSTTDNPTIIVRQFEHQLQKCIGYELNYLILEEYSDCSWFAFDPEQGLHPASHTISDNKIHRSTVENLEKGQLDNPQTQTASKHIFNKILQHLLGKKQLFITQMLPK